MSGIGGIFGHPNAAAKPNGGSQLDGASPLTSMPQFGSVAPLVLPEVSRQYSYAIRTAFTAPANQFTSALSSPIVVPAGQRLVLARVGYVMTGSAGVHWSIAQNILGTQWIASGYGPAEEAPDTVLIDNGAGNVSGAWSILFGFDNSTGSSGSVTGTIWCNMLIQ